MDLPSSLAPPGSAALVALREWHAPAFFESRVPSYPTAIINQAGVLSLTVRAGAAEALVANGPEYALSEMKCTKHAKDRRPTRSGEKLFGEERDSDIVRDLNSTSLLIFKGKATSEAAWKCPILRPEL